MLPLAAIIIVYLLCFFESTRSAGFYLDDWMFIDTFWQGPEGFVEAYVNLMQTDPRFLNRPVEALLFLASYKAFGTNPLGYHIFNDALEITASWLIFLCFKRTTNAPLISLLCALLFLLLPTHNATHYWVSCICVNLSLCLYLGSLFCDIEGAIRGRTDLHIASAIIFLTGLLNYEIFLPLAALNVMAVFLLRTSKQSYKDSLVYALKPLALLTVSTIFLFVYLKLIMPLFGKAWMHRIAFEPALFFKNLLAGIVLNSPMSLGPFIAEKLKQAFGEGLATVQWLKLAGIAAVVSIPAILNKILPAQANSCSDQKATKVAGAFLILGFLSVLASYTIFGFNPEYLPTLDTTVNRINIAASIGLSMVFCSALLFLLSFFNKSKKWNALAPLAVTLPLIAAFTITNWTIAKPYELSWQVQSYVMDKLKENKVKLQNYKFLILSGCSRYSGEAPVLDGIWDFRPMARIALNRPELDGTVVSSRLQVAKSGIRDMVGDLVCTSNDFNGMIGIFIPSFIMIEISGPNQFVDLIEERGLQFESKDLTKPWREKLKER